MTKGRYYARPASPSLGADLEPAGKFKLGVIKRGGGRTHLYVIVSPTHLWTDTTKRLALLPWSACLSSGKERLGAPDVMDG